MRASAARFHRRARLSWSGWELLPGPVITPIIIASARFPEDADEVRALFREYMDSLRIDLSFQNAAAELAALPGPYAAPRGVVLLARGATRLLGCVALRPLSAQVCELKRLYVRPAARGQDLGRRLTCRVLEHARAVGYARMLLDTLAPMDAAQRLYAALGFRDVPAYYDNPLPGTRYMALDLNGAES